MCVGVCNKKKLLEKIAEFKKMLKGKNTFIGYKVIRLDGKPSMFSQNFKYKPGINYAKGERNRIKSKNRYLVNNAGIHVFLRPHMSFETYQQARIEVMCHIDDLIAVDNRQAALLSVYITDKQWRAFQRRVNKKIKEQHKAELAMATDQSIISI